MTDLPLHWAGGRLDGTPWQGISYLSLELHQGADHPAILTAHLNQPVGSLTPDHVVVRGGQRPVPAYDVALAGSTATISFRTLGDSSPYTVTLTDGGGSALHPFFSSATFRFRIDCEVGDCAESPSVARRQVSQPPAVDLVTKDFHGFVSLLADWVKVHNPSMADLSSASFERVLLDLLAWAGDMTSYYQDRVANEAFIETATQRFSLRQHAILLGTRVYDGCAPTTVLAFDTTTSGFVPAGLQVRMRTSPDEVPLSYTVATRTRLLAENSSNRLRIAAFSGAGDAELPIGATSALLWGHDMQLRTGDRLAFVQGSLAQVVTLTAAPQHMLAAGWVQDPEHTFDPLTDPPAQVTKVQWAQPLAQAVRPWGPVPLTLHANLADARYGTPRRAFVSAYASPSRNEIAFQLTRRNCIVRGRDGSDVLLLRALRVPEWPVVHDDDGTGISVPAVTVTISGDVWTRVEHLHSSLSYDQHYVAAADEDGAIWLRFGDGVNGREIPLTTPEQPAVQIELSYRIGDPVAGNVGLGTLVEIVRPATGTDEQTALDALGTVAVTNVLPATGGRAPHTLAGTKQELPSSLRHGPLQRAVALADYAAVAMQVPGVGRATARSAGGLFNTVMVLIDPEGAGDLAEGLRQQVYQYLDTLRMTGREHVVLAAEYVPLEVQLLLCAQPGFAAHLVRDRVLVELRPGTSEHPGWFHPDRHTFGDTVRLGDLLAFVQGIPGVRTVKATAFRPLRESAGPAVRDVIMLSGTKVARLDADPDFPEHGTLTVHVIGLDGDQEALVIDREPVA